jgi:hypothetical protein
MNDVPQFLREAADLFAKHNKLYKDNYHKVGAIYALMFPNGITLRTPADFNRFAIVVQMVNKLVRYSFNWVTGHPDSLDDLSIYAMMLKELDNNSLPKLSDDRFINALQEFIDGPDATHLMGNDFVFHVKGYTVKVSRNEEPDGAGPVPPTDAGSA